MDTKSDYYIKIADVSLKFPLYTNNDPNAKSALINFITKNDSKNSEKKYFHAIKNINLTFEKNQTIGIIGSNGAGKSTLISLISDIYSPSEGYIETKGKIVTLMGMGVGFNANLDAVENIKIAGLIMGLDKRELQERVQRILEFAELEKFSRLPIKYYSKGMKARLGFSTATEVSPEILLLDEVFSGGDLHWVKKAEDRMKSIIADSKIVIIVSHSMNRVADLCNRTVWLDRGEVKMDGPPEEVIPVYKNKA